jgi:hypothetical protein
MTNSAATPSSWKTLAAPQNKEPLALEATFTDAEAEQITRGLVPEQMEDKWFIYYSDGWLHFHRSWTGALIYWLRLDGSPAGVRVTESWVNRNQAQYGGTDTSYDRQLVRFLIDAFLLKKSARFPMPGGSDSEPQGVVQHSYVGRAYPEQPSPSGDAASDA